MKALVTGGAGFIGSHLVEKLIEQGHEVVVLDNFMHGNKLSHEAIAAIHLIEGDVRNQNAVLEAAMGCNWIFHFAAVLGVDLVADNPAQTMETEILGMINIINAAMRFGTDKIIYASTSGVYGKSAIEEAVREEIDVSPRSSYSIAKRYNEIYLKALYQQKILHSVSLRYFNVYGPRQDNRMVVPRFFEQAMANQSITVYGSGRQTRDFTYVDDIVKATILVAEKVRGCEIINTSDEKEWSIAELAEMIIKITGSKSHITFIDPPPGRYDFEVERRCGSNAKLKRLVGWTPDTDIKEGLTKVFTYYKLARRT